MTFDALAVVPVLVGPIQALLALLPAILVALGGLIAGLFRPSALKKGLKLLWRLKVSVVILVAAIAGAVTAIRAAFPASTGTVTQQEASAQDWPLFRGGPQRTGSVPGSPAPTQGGMNWSFAGDAKTFYSSPAVVGNRVYATSTDIGVFKDSGAIYCLDAETGGLVWKSAPTGYRATFSSPALAGKYLVCGEGLHLTRDARVVCLDTTQQGKILWEYRTKSHVESSPAIDKNRVYIGAGDDGYYCFELEPDAAGKPRVVWHAPGDAFPDAETSPAVVDGKVFVGLGLGGRAVCCLDAETGKELWRVPAPYPVFAPPTVAGGKVYVAMGNGNFVMDAEAAMEPELDKLRKQGKSAAEIEEARKQLGPAGEVWCLDAATGTVEWRFKLGRTVLGAVAAGSDRLFFGSRDGHVYAVSPQGKELGRWKAHAPIVSGTALTADHVYVVTVKGKLYGLELQKLLPVWETTVGSTGEFYSSPAVARGHVYVGSPNDGILSLGSVGVKKKPPWAGYLAGPGRAGSIDGVPLPESGSLLWRYPAGDGAKVTITAPAACFDDAVLVPIAAGPKKGLACLRQTAIEAWFAETPNGVRLSPAASAAGVFFVDGARGEIGRHLRAIDPSNGAERWKLPVAPEASGEFVLGEDAIFIQDGGDTLALVDLAGKVLWRRQTGAIVQSPAWRASVLVVALEKPAAVVALDRPSGRELWRAALEAAPTTGPAVREKTVYVGTAAGLAAHRLIDGKPLWHAKEGGVEKAFAMGRDTIYYVSAESELILIDPKDGSLKTKLPGASKAVPPVLSRESALYVVEGNLLVYDPAAGFPLKWMDSAPLGAISSPVVTANSRIYFALEGQGFIRAGK